MQALSHLAGTAVGKSVDTIGNGGNVESIKLSEEKVFANFKLAVKNSHQKLMTGIWDNNRGLHDKIREEYACSHVNELYSRLRSHKNVRKNSRELSEASFSSFNNSKKIKTSSSYDLYLPTMQRSNQELQYAHHNSQMSYLFNDLCDHRQTNLNYSQRIFTLSSEGSLSNIKLNPENNLSSNVQYPIEVEEINTPNFPFSEAYFSVDPNDPLGLEPLTPINYDDLIGIIFSN